MQHHYAPQDASYRSYKATVAPSPRRAAPPPSPAAPPAELLVLAPRIPVVAPSYEGLEEEGLLSPRRVMQQVDAFGAMCDAGAGWGAALVHALQGHKMTEEQVRSRRPTTAFHGR